MKTDINIFQTDDGEFCMTVIDADERTYELFEELELQGGGYTWEGIVTALIEMRMPEALPTLRIGAEADNMYAYSRDRDVLERIAELIRTACADHTLLKAAIDHAGDDLE
jgi:hypothetical protein